MIVFELVWSIHEYKLFFFSAGYKQVKCLLLTYIVVCFLWVVVLVVGGVLAYIFRQQVADTILAEMIAEIRNYDPSDSHSSVTRSEMSQRCVKIRAEWVMGN